MILLIHVAIAVVNIVYSVFTLVNPSLKRIRNIYLLTLLAFASGAILSIQSSVSIGRTCLTGIFYLGLVVTISKLAKYRLQSMV